MAWAAQPDVSDSGYPEASRWFRKKLAISNAEWDSLSDRARQRAFSVGGVTQLELVQDVWSAIDKAVANGTTFKDFQDDVGEKLAAAWGGADPFRLETIFRTNVQASLNAGRYEQQNDQIVLSLRPYLRFSSILDSRTTQVCSAAHGTILPAGDPWWATHQPPLHFNCRSTAVSLTEQQVKDLGGVAAEPTDKSASPGFGGPPSIEWAPDVSKYSPELLDTFLARKDVPPEPPLKKPEHTTEHWREVYRSQGFGHEAATSLANGRAAQERGLDVPVNKVQKTLADVLSSDHAKLFEEHLGKLDLRGRKTKTLRELIDDPLVTGNPLEKSRLQALATLYGHASDLGDSKASTAMFTSERWSARKTARAQLIARQITGQAVARVAPYLSSDAIPSAVEITWNSGRRAGALAGKILISPSTERLAGATLEHEFGHNIEYASAARLRASDQFLEKRAGADVPKQLRGLTGIDYKRDEYTHEDRFRNPYVGKIYGRRGAIYGSEVLSMGLQWLSDPAQVVAFFHDDPEHFLFVIGQLASR